MLSRPQCVNWTNNQCAAWATVNKLVWNSMWVSDSRSISLLHIMRKRWNHVYEKWKSKARRTPLRIPLWMHILHYIYIYETYIYKTPSFSYILYRISKLMGICILCWMSGLVIALCCADSIFSRLLMIFSWMSTVIHLCFAKPDVTNNSKMDII